MVTQNGTGNRNSGDSNSIFNNNSNNNNDNNNNNTNSIGAETKPKTVSPPVRNDARQTIPQRGAITGLELLTDRLSDTEDRKHKNMSHKETIKLS